MTFFLFSPRRVHSAVRVIQALSRRERVGLTRVVSRLEALAEYRVKYLPLHVRWRQFTVIHFDKNSGLITDHVDHWSLEVRPTHSVHLFA